MKMIAIRCAALAALMVLGCSQKRFDREALSVSRGLDLDGRIGQMLMVAIPGSAMNTEAEKILERYRPGGVILFGYNLSKKEDNRKFIAGLQDTSLRHAGTPLFVSIDQEGGRVVRVVSGVTQFPGNMAAGIADNTRLAYRWGRALGLQLRETGINMNLAPVLDVNNNPHNPVINTRSFGADPRLVAKLGAAYIRGLQDSRCIAVGKHFPGHGDTNQDSHLTLPVIRYGLDRLERVELVPFRKAVRSGVEGIMTAHIAFPEILGTNDPATVSPELLSVMLRGDLGFRGLVITDDMEMHAISRRQEMGEAAVRSVLAGADIILMSSHGATIGIIRDAMRRAVKEKRITPERINESVARIMETKMRYDIASPVDGGQPREAFILTRGDRRALYRAQEVNERLSRRGVLYYGDLSFLDSGAGRTRIFVTKSPVLRKELARNEMNVILDDFDSFRGYRTRDGGDAVLYLHLSRPEVGLLRNAASYCTARGVPLVMVSSGNPFPLTTAGLVRAGLVSFSDTEESLRQLGRCLNGEFSPAGGGAALLGIEDR
ncbi:MAG: hypothetical protein JW838_09225 [Spirochaetes bacterium]|nr:hypothetical protein [Spirochaetota bacterium]